MSRDELYTEYAIKLRDKFPEWPKEQEDMEKLLQTLVICVEKCIKNKRSQKTAIASKVWLAYVKAYKQRWEVEPPTSAKNYMMCKSLMDHVGSEQAVALVEYFLTQNDSWYVKNYHPLSALLANQNYQGLLTRMKTGKVVSTKKAQSLEKASNTAQASMDYLKEKHGKR